MTFKLSNKSKERLKGVDYRLIKVIDLALAISAVDFGIPEFGGFRTTEQQAHLFEMKKSKCDGKKDKSLHQLAMAFDVYAYVDGAASWDKYHLTQVAVAILQAAGLLGYQLHWGGLWKSFVDMPHFELVEKGVLS